MTTLTLPKSISTTAVAVAVSLTMTATALAARVGSTQVAAKAGEPSPATIHGTAVHRGDVLGGGQTVVSRAIAVKGHERRLVRMVCRPGQRLHGLALRSLADGVGFAVRPHTRSYVNRRTVTVRVFALDRTAATTAHGVLYALCGPRA